jgi:hypothetical protein
MISPIVAILLWEALMFHQKTSIDFRAAVLSVPAFLFLLPVLFAQTMPQHSPTGNVARTAELPLYLKVQVDPKVELSHLKSGDVVEGRLSRGVYRGAQELFPPGTLLHLTVDKLQRRRRIPNDHWPWVVRVFTPRHETYPVFRWASVLLPDGSVGALRVSVISAAHKIEVRSAPKGKKRSTQSAETYRAPTRQVAGETMAHAQEDPARGTSKPRNAGRTLVLQAAIANPAQRMAPQPDGDPYLSPTTSAVTLPAGTQARIVLLNRITASKGRAGDSFCARLIEPVRLGSQVVLPEGSILQGKVVKDTRPRMLSRAGALLLSFNSLRTPSGSNAHVVASVYAINVDRSSHTKVDSEGELRGDHPGKAWMFANIGVTAGISKLADDGSQLVIESLVSTATDVSTAGVARVVSTCVGGIFMLTRHGRDVVLPKFTEMSIVFDRPVSIAGPVPDASANQTSAGD